MGRGYGRGLRTDADQPISRKKIEDINQLVEGVDADVRVFYDVVSSYDVAWIDAYVKGAG